MKVHSKTIAFNEEPSRLLDIFKDEQGVFFLDSSLCDDTNGRFSFLGFAPFKVVRPKDFIQLRKEISPFLGLKSRSAFPAGAVGYIGYEGELCFGLYEGLICVDHHKRTLTVSSTGLPYKEERHRAQAARQKIDHVLYQLHNHHARGGCSKKFKGKLALKSNTTLAQYVARVKKALGHIHEGDIYQINLSHRLQAGIKDWRQYAHPGDIYQRLRSLSPSSFGAYLDLGGQVILSSSPERFLRLTKAVAQVRPMKGTRPRGANAREDERNRQELLESAKEKAELLMVTDLERNDLGRVCRYGSVKVRDMRTIEKYATVFQATSTVEGELRQGCDLFDLLENTFPSGSVTGCPKIEAMKIIRRLEKSPRGLYTGALGYISFTGDMDFNVLIRTLLLEKDMVSFSVGGGIVADSDPKKEYEETLIKARAMIEALKKAF